MEPFSLICPSCQGKLAVKNEALIGKTAPCPRCQEPIKVELPKIVLGTPANLLADSHAITKVADDDWMEGLDQAIEEHRRSTEGESAEQPRFRNEEDEYSLAPLPSDAFANNIEPETKSTFSIAHSPAVQATKASKPLFSPDSPRSKQILFIAGLGLLGLTLSAGLFYAFIKFASKPTGKPGQQVAQAGSNKPVNGEEKAGSEPLQGAGEKLPNADPSTISSEGSSSEKASSGQSSKNDPATINDPNSAGSNPSTTTSDAPESTNTATPANTPEAGTGVPGGTEPKMAGPATDKELQGAEDNPTPKNPPFAFPFGKPFELTLPGDEVPTMPSIHADDPTPVSRDSVEFFPLQRLDHPPASPLPAGDKTLLEPLHQLTYRDRPLADAIHLLTVLTGNGITLDLESLAALGIASDATVSIEAEETTYGKMFEGFLAPLGLMVSVRDDGLLVVHATDDAVEQKLPKTWSLEIKGADPQVWSVLLAKILPEEGTLWHLDGSQIVWQPTARPIQKFRVAIVIDRIKTAIGVPVVSNYLKKDLAVGLDFRNMQSQLEHKGESILVERRSLIQLLAEVVRKENLQLVIDWPGVWQHGLSPKIQELSLVRFRTIPEIFSYHNTRFNLNLVAVDPQTLLLTIPESRRLRTQIRVIPMKEGDTVASIRNQLKNIAPTDIAGNNQLKIIEIPGHPFALARICPPLVSELQDIVLGE